MKKNICRFQGGKITMSVLAIVLIIVAIIVAGFFFFAVAGLGKVRRLSIEKIDLTKVEDGVYPGEFKGYRWSNKVEVTVKNHQIVGIKIIKDVTFGMGELSKKLFDQIIQKQSLQVDTVSNATVTCNAYLKAIENALLKGK